MNTYLTKHCSEPDSQMWRHTLVNRSMMINCRAGICSVLAHQKWFSRFQDGRIGFGPTYLFEKCIWEKDLGRCLLFINFYPNKSKSIQIKKSYFKECSNISTCYAWSFLALCLLCYYVSFSYSKTLAYDKNICL